VGTRTLAPSTASSSVIGSSRRRSVPLRVNSACGATDTVIRRSPARPPEPASPCPFRRMTCPSFNPAGILTSTSRPVGSCKGLSDSFGRFRKRDRERSTDVLPGATPLLEAEAGLPRTAGASERFLQNVLEAAETASAPAGVLKPVSPPAEGFEHLLWLEAALP